MWIAIYFKLLTISHVRSSWGPLCRRIQRFLHGTKHWMLCERTHMYSILPPSQYSPGHDLKYSPPWAVVLRAQSPHQQPATGASPGSLLKMQILRSHLRATESETLGVKSKICLLASIQMHAQIWELVIQRITRVLCCVGHGQGTI